jgi:hypothetical protein
MFSQLAIAICNIIAPQQKDGEWIEESTRRRGERKDQKKVKQQHKKKCGRTMLNDRS